MLFQRPEYSPINKRKIQSIMHSYNHAHKQTVDHNLRSASDSHYSTLIFAPLWKERAKIWLAIQKILFSFLIIALVNFWICNSPWHSSTCRPKVQGLHIFILSTCFKTQINSHKCCKLFFYDASPFHQSSETGNLPFTSTNIHKSLTQKYWQVLGRYYSNAG